MSYNNSNMTIKLPKDVWQLIIDKMEPRLYKLPKYMFIHDIGVIDTEYIYRVSEPDYSGRYIEIHFTVSGRYTSYSVFKEKDPYSYGLFEELIDYYKSLRK